MDVSDLFYFFLFGGGKREEASEEVAGGPVSMKNRGRGGGVPRRRRGRGRAPWECLRGKRGGGLNIFFSGPKCPPRK